LVTSALPVVAEVVRSGFVEGRHRGCVVALAADGSVAFAVGDASAPVFPRSSNKPMQAAGMVDAGLGLSGELLALAAASHSGEPFHLDGVRKILAGAGLAIDQLQTPADYPYDAVIQREWIAAGHGPEPLAMNCSGKHAAMLATCVANHWDTATYRDPAHPLQLALRATLERLAGEQVSATGVDGCGAPVLAISLLGLARAGRACVLGGPSSAERQVADAMRAHPQWVGGSRRDVTALMRGVPGLLAKDGAEGVSMVALADGRAVAVKIEDGAQRARQVVTAAALQALGVNADVVAAQLTFELLGGGRPVGTVRAVALA
jgi:L-asparaginase II